jgi:hypothetical protein
MVPYYVGKPLNLPQIIIYYNKLDRLIEAFCARVALSDRQTNKLFMLKHTIRISLLVPNFESKLLVLPQILI